MRVKLPDGFRIMPHTRPKDERGTVISWTLYLGTGATFGAKAAKAMPAGSNGRTGAGMKHFGRSGVEPWAYLQDVLTRLPTTPAGQPGALLPPLASGVPGQHSNPARPPDHVRREIVRPDPLQPWHTASQPGKFRASPAGPRSPDRPDSRPLSRPATRPSIPSCSRNQAGASTA